jgi:hypothetical protein
MTQLCQIKQRYTFHLHPALLNNTCVKHNFKSVRNNYYVVEFPGGIIIMKWNFQVE